MTTVLAVAIGLMLMYLILSLIVSTMNEGLASLTDRRADFLWKGVENLLGPKLTKEFYDHGLIRGLTHKRALAHRKPSYISSSTFGTTVLDLVSRPPNPGPGAGSQATDTAPQDVAELKRRIEALDDPEVKDLREALVAFAKEEKEWSDIKKRIETWFDEAMERVSGWYKRRTRVVLWALALALVVALNADTVNVARVLWLDPTVRSAAEAAARETVQEEGAGQPTTGQEPAEVAKEAVDAVRQLEQIGLPLRWSDATTPDDLPGWILKVLGLVITAFALTFGAPFWFDLLKKFVGVQASGPPPAETAEGKK